MSRSRGYTTIVAGLIALAAGAAALPCQTVAVGMGVFRANHELLGAPLTGPEATLLVPLGDSVVSFRLSAERYAGTAERTGIPCAGLINPGTCSTPERLRDDGSFTAATAGVVMRAYAVERVAVDVDAAWVAGQVTVDTRGLTSGGRLHASKEIWGPELGAGAHWTPLARVPVALGVDAAYRFLGPVRNDQVEDGYTPFESAFRAWLVRGGVAWRIPRH